MGYALNLCKFHIYNVPYNHNIAEEGMEMTQNRIRIVDVADALGLSTATVSNVIHGKTEKISDETVKRVQQELERSGYIPNMAGILLARNNSSLEVGTAVKVWGRIQSRVYQKKNGDQVEERIAYEVSVSKISLHTEENPPQVNATEETQTDLAK